MAVVRARSVFYRVHYFVILLQWDPRTHARRRVGGIPYINIIYPYTSEPYYIISYTRTIIIVIITLLFLPCARARVRDISWAVIYYGRAHHRVTSRNRIILRFFPLGVFFFFTSLFGSVYDENSGRANQWAVPASSYYLLPRPVKQIKD